MNRCASRRRFATLADADDGLGDDFDSRGSVVPVLIRDSMPG